MVIPSLIRESLLRFVNIIPNGGWSHGDESPWGKFKNQWDYIDPSAGDLLVALALSFVKKNRGEDTPWKMNILHPKSWRFGSNDVPFHLGAFEVNQSLIFRGEDTGKLWQWTFQGWNNHQIKCFFGLKLEGQSPNKPDHKVLKRDIFFSKSISNNESNPPKKTRCCEIPSCKNNLENFVGSEHVCLGQRVKGGGRLSKPTTSGISCNESCDFSNAIWEVKGGWCHKLPYSTTYSSRFFLLTVFFWKNGKSPGVSGVLLESLITLFYWKMAIFFKGVTFSKAHQGSSICPKSGNFLPTCYFFWGQSAAEISGEENLPTPRWSRHEELDNNASGGFCSSANVRT